MRDDFGERLWFCITVALAIVCLGAAALALWTYYHP